ncbi:MAG: PAS domain-containing protein [Candidatus Zixiibacteriota bacterium]|nr:MAG: PAS domain-containing protein [candidate division Zixibacteria bacterium]
MDDKSKTGVDTIEGKEDAQDISRFADSYASFSRIINSLQRKYIELKDEFSAQNAELSEANRKLVDLSRKNITATEFLNGILNSISAGVVAIDLNGCITHFNPAASVILGIPVREPLGKAYRDVIPPGTPVGANALRTAESGREVDSVEKRIELGDGTRLQLSVSTAVLRDDAGGVVGAVEVFQDLTKFRKMEREIARLNTLAALGEMAATVAHEVRNPLAGIGGFAGLLERDLEDGDSRKELVRKIIRGVSSLNETVETLLNYTRFEEVNRVEVDYEDFLKTTIEQFMTDNQPKLDDIIIEYVAVGSQVREAVSVCLDKMLFRQILFNILCNSVEACRGEGIITVSMQKLPRQTALSRYSDRLMLAINETVVETAVTDDGCGIEQEHIDRLFAPFFTTKSEGNGLGLAVAWKIMKAHGGEIFVENNKDSKGATFYLLMPVPINGGCME